MKIVLNAKDLPDWLNLGQLGVDLMFDERTYLEMEKALDQVLHADRNRLAELRDILLFYHPPSFQTTPQNIVIPELNTSQNKAVQQILAANEVCIIHGPPGTGKTTTLVQATKELSKTATSILVSAPSNTAVDLLTERLVTAGLFVVRVGNISRVDDAIIPHTLEAQLANHPESKHIKKVKIEAAAARREARRFKRKFGYEERQMRKHYSRKQKNYLPGQYNWKSGSSIK